MAKLTQAVKEEPKSESNALKESKSLQRSKGGQQKCSGTQEFLVRLHLVTTC
jgi:hypothetical protein